ncbi:MAG: hypothetical protein R3F38_13185 [Gammaproteobacteria bacterium]
MSTPKLAITLILLIIAGAGVYWVGQDAARQPPATGSAPVSAVPATPPQPDPLQQLAEHHCATLGDTAASSACVSQILADMHAGKTAPVIPELQPESCKDLTDLAEQHRCHGRLGHDYAISTGDITKCDVIPMEDIRQSCRTAIIVNEVKKLQALETASSGTTQP